MRLSVEDSTEVPLFLTDLVKLVRPGAVTPVVAGMLMSRPIVQQVLCRTRSKERYSIAWMIQNRDHSLSRNFYLEIQFDTFTNWNWEQFASVQRKVRSTYGSR